MRAQVRRAGYGPESLDVLVVDDEQLARLALRSLLKQRADISRVREAESIEAAVDALADPPGVIFLDVQLVEENGFDLFTRIEVRVPVVFVTAHDNYAVRAFGVDAIDYLLKPVLREHLDRALTRVHRRRDEQNSREVRISLHARKDVFLARAREICFLRADGDYSEVHLADGRQVRVKESLESWQERLPSCFARIHRSFLANLDEADGLVSRDGRLQLRMRRSSLYLPVSRRLASGLRKRIA